MKGQKKIHFPKNFSGKTGAHRIYCHSTALLLYYAKLYLGVYAVMKKLRFTALCAAGMMLAALTAGCGGDNPADTSAKTYVVLEDSLDAEQYGIGFRNEDIALGLEVQKHLDEMIQDGTAAEISNKWFGEDILLKDQAYLEESTAPSGDDSLTKIQNKGKLVLGLDDSFPPMGFRDESDTIVGFDIDLATEVAKRMGVTLEVQPIDWDAKEMELSTGRIDCIWNGMSVDDDRLAAMFFAKPYVANRQIVIVPSDSDIKTVADLAGKKVGLQKGSTALSALKKNAVFEQMAEVVELADNVTVFMDLKAGRVDAFVVDEVVGRYIISTDQGEQE